jgi:hypothetical protein
VPGKLRYVRTIEVRWLLPIVAALALVACDRGGAKVDPGTKIEQAARDLGEAAKKGDLSGMGDATRQLGRALGGSASIEPVDHRELQALLPESVAGMKRTGSEGSRSNLVGITASHAQADYGDGKGASLSIEITDMGSLTGVTALAFAWVSIDIDRQSDVGYERTTMIGGRKAYERYSRAERKGELDVLVASRFIVSVKGTDMDMKSFKDVVAKIDVDRLEKLKDKGLPPVASPPAAKPAPPKRRPKPEEEPDRA